MEMSFRRALTGRFGTRGFGLAAALTALLPYAVIATPAAAEEIRIVMTSEPQDLDPGNIEFRFTGQVARHSVIEGLVLHDLRTQEIVPRLATDWERTGDLTWRFTLREGVTFHDGAPFNADAVIASYERLMVPEIEQVNRSRFFEGLELTLTKVDDLTVDVELNAAEPLFLEKFANLPIVSPNMSRTELSRAPIGTGPFRFVEWNAGVEIVLERFEDYWGDLPETTRAVFMWREEPSIRASMVEVGEADLTFSIDEQAATNPATDQPYVSFEVLYYIIGAWEPPLDDVRVRKAVNLSIDREALIGTVLPAQSVPAVALYGPFTAGHNPDLEPHPYDPEQARALLDEARADGVPVDTQIQVLGINGHFPRSDEVLEAVTAMLSASGFNAVSRTMEAGSSVSIATSRGSRKGRSCFRPTTTTRPATPARRSPATAARPCATRSAIRASMNSWTPALLRKARSARRYGRSLRSTCTRRCTSTA
jgi:peptide/nickel transport system substrate-binding protein